MFCGYTYGRAYIHSKLVNYFKFSRFSTVVIGDFMSSFKYKRVSVINSDCGKLNQNVWCARKSVSHLFSSVITISSSVAIRWLLGGL